MHSAYRQVPLPHSQTSVSVTAVYEPDSGEVHMFALLGQPFGAGHAVPNFYPVAEWAAHACVKGYGLMLDHFFDDFLLWIESNAVKCAVRMFCVQQSFELRKVTPTSSLEVAYVLGVAFNTRSLAEQRSLLAETKPTRGENFGILVKKILESDMLPPSLAASLLGKFGFLCSTLFW